MNKSWRFFIVIECLFALLAIWQIINNKAIVMIPYVIPFVVFIIGVVVFNKHSKKFAEIL